MGVVFRKPFYTLAHAHAHAASGGLSELALGHCPVSFTHNPPTLKTRLEYRETPAVNMLCSSLPWKQGWIIGLTQQA